MNRDRAKWHRIGKNMLAITNSYEGRDRAPVNECAWHRISI